MKKTILALTTVAMLSATSVAYGAGDEEPKTVCGFLQKMSQSMERMETIINNRLDQLDDRLTGLESKVAEVKRDVDQVTVTLGSFDGGDVPKKVVSDDPCAPLKTEKKKFYHRKTGVEWKSPCYKKATWSLSLPSLLKEIDEGDFVSILPLEDYGQGFQTKTKEKRVWDPQNAIWIENDKNGYLFHLRENVISKVPATLAKYLFEQGVAEILV